MANAADANKAEIRELFERGDVYADRWGPQLRAALDVSDPLVELVAGALQNGRSVVLSGNAGDGKSHLAQCALDRLPSRTCLEVTADHMLPNSVPAEAIVFVRDVSSLSNAQALQTARDAAAAGSPLLLTINEGPLSSLAQEDPESIFRKIRDVLHNRAMGGNEPDHPEFLILNLAGRQLTRSVFVSGVLAKLLPVVTSCPTCGKNSNCPRLVGAKLLKNSKRAQERIQELLRLLTDGGRHVSAREIWVFLIDLFFGWVCPPGAPDSEKTDGYFWMRMFNESNPLSCEIASYFDPIMVPMAREDVHIWQGAFEKISSDVDYPGERPSSLARDSEEAGLDAFASAKRCFFFFGKDLDVAELLTRRSLAPAFGQLLDKARTEPRPIIRELVGLINSYRIHMDTENDLWISRHHGYAAQRRPSGLGAAGKVSIDSIELKVPNAFEADLYSTSGFFPTRVYLCWMHSDQYLPIDFDTWQELRSARTLTVDRNQETLDFALDLFLSQADLAASDDPEIHVFDHVGGETTVLRIRPEERRLEVIN